MEDRHSGQNTNRVKFKVIQEYQPADLVGCFVKDNAVRLFRCRREGLAFNRSEQSQTRGDE